jgi:L-threonylcarbamoyladenylate synthase
MEDLHVYTNLIKKGEVVAFPTETVYGLGADAWNPSAIKKIFELKGRPSDNPLIVHVASEKDMLNFAAHIPKVANKLVEAFWPGPLSLVLRKKSAVLDAITAGLETVAIRMPGHPIALEFIKQTGPLVAPSANLSGRPSPTKAGHVRADFGVDFPVIDGEATQVGIESTVLDLTEAIPAILRPGSISRKEVEDVIGSTVEESFFHFLKNPRSPGQKYSHYKPEAEVRWFAAEKHYPDDSAMYLLNGTDLAGDYVVNYKGDLKLMARELFDRFREADHAGIANIYVELPNEFAHHPVYSALANRISKARGTKKPD